MQAGTEVAARAVPAVARQSPAAARGAEPDLADDARLERAARRWSCNPAGARGKLATTIRMSYTPIDRPYPSPIYAWYVVGVLLVAYIFSFVDREVLALLVEPIKRDLGLTDTEMGWLMGPAFAIIYTFFGIALLQHQPDRRRSRPALRGLRHGLLFSRRSGLALLARDRRREHLRARHRSAAVLPPALPRGLRRSQGMGVKNMPRIRP